MKPLYDLLPLALFFLAYLWFDIFTATAVAIAAAGGQLAWGLIRHRRLERTQLVNFVLIGALGGLTLFLRDPTFLKWKPTVVNWIFGLVFLGNLMFWKKPLLEQLLGHQVQLAASVWRKLTWAWIIFFLFCGLLNLYVAFGYKTDQSNLSVKQQVILQDLLQNDDAFIIHILKRSPAELTTQQRIDTVPKTASDRTARYLDVIHLDLWVKFKVFGILGLTLLFILGQSIYLARHFKDSTLQTP